MKKIIFTIITLFCVVFSFAQNNNRTIYVDIIYPKIEKDTVSLEYQHNGWSLNALDKIKLKDSLANNHFEITPNKDDKYLYLTLSGKNRYLLINYLATPGDSIQIYVEPENVIFRGRGYEKYKCKYDMEKIVKDFPYQNPYRKYNTVNGDMVKDSIYYTNYIPGAYSVLNRTYSSSKCGLEVLNWYRPKLTDDIYYILKGNLLSKAEKILYNDFKQHFNGFKKDADYTQKRNIQDSLITIYLNRDAYDFSKIPDSLLAYSQEYLGYVSSIFLLDEDKFASSIAEYNNTPSSSYGLQGIINNFNGILRDRAITRYLIQRFSDLPNISVQIDQALKFVNDSNCRDLLFDLRNTNSKGSNAYNFQLPDKNGKVRTLEEFKGKVILMDFWYTGCAGCRIMAENLKPVAEYFNKNKKVVFISVSSDGDISTWKNSVEKGIYTNKHSLDLFTEGKGADHPMIKNYKVMIYPTLIMIGKAGEIITTSVIKPIDEKSKNDLIKFIENNI